MSVLNPTVVATKRNLLVVIILLLVAAAFVALMWPDEYRGPRVARERYTRENLQIIRKAIADFRADTGVFPVDLKDLCVTNAAMLQTPDTQHKYRGPYLKEGERAWVIPGTTIPTNELRTDRKDTAVDHHWQYNPTTGEVHSALRQSATDGTNTMDW